ncbi:MAG: DUF4363 domain-containing protein [Candidatus Paraimprobicoccus trichonymphae]|uniref:DUF4363 domain-containing protein n=1 Tax=Candidatus Paraimprobicoccus trichonymphae TaxID=3033793 RepID=A0AA48I263_9FIRM|nr:MAG: DUF4363 domain-containing protein [Candidatus Paraimprobicoccus trichonymphae]
MKKILFFSSFLFLIVILVSWFNFYYTNKTANIANLKTSQIQKSAKQCDYNKALNQARELEEYWISSHTIMEIFIHHDVIENIDQSISVIIISLSIFLEGGNMSDLSIFWYEMAKLIPEFNNLKDIETPSIGNIL